MNITIKELHMICSTVAQSQLKQQQAPSTSDALCWISQKKQEKLNYG